MFSLIIRRTHMYLALFLSPWVLVYALSTIAMNHREHVGTGPPVFRLEAEQPYSAVFPDNAAPREMAVQILRDLGMDGAHGAQRPAGGKLVINRFDPIQPKRLTYDAEQHTVRIESVEFRTPAFLERMHRRRGFQHNYALEDTWAFSVDLFIAAMIFWVLSGLWMWWEMRVTRKLGALFALGGLALFAFFLMTI